MFDEHITKEEFTIFVTEEGIDFCVNVGNIYAYITIA